MGWIKRNLFFVGAACLAVALIGFAGFYNFAATKHRAQSGTEERGAIEVSDPAHQRSSSLNRSVAAIPKNDNGASEIAKLTVRCRAVIPSDAAGNAATTIAYALQNELRAVTNFFDPQATELGPEIHRDRDTDTFSFDVALVLKRPIKL